MTWAMTEWFGQVSAGVSMSCSLLGNSGHPDPHCTLLHEFMAETCPDSWLNDSTQLEALLKALEPCPAEWLDRFFSKRSKSCLKTHFSSGAAPRLERCLNNHNRPVGHSKRQLLTWTLNCLNPSGAWKQTLQETSCKSWPSFLTPSVLLATRNEKPADPSDIQLLWFSESHDMVSYPTWCHLNSMWTIQNFPSGFACSWSIALSSWSGKHQPAHRSHLHSCQNLAIHRPCRFSCGLHWQSTASWLADDPKHRVFAHPEAQRPPAPGLHDFVQTDIVYIYIYVNIIIIYIYTYHKYVTYIYMYICICIYIYIYIYICVCLCVWVQWMDMYSYRNKDAWISACSSDAELRVIRSPSAVFLDAENRWFMGGSQFIIHDNPW